LTIHHAKAVPIALAALVIVSAARAAVPVDKVAMHRALFDSYYADFARRNPEAFVRQRLAILAPDQLQTIQAMDVSTANLDTFFRALPKVELSIDVPPFSVSYGVDQIGALRDLIARTPLGAGLPGNDTLDHELTDYIRTRPDEVAATGRMIYDLYNGASTPFTSDQVRMLKEQFDKDVATDGTLPKPTDSLESLLLNAPPAFDRAMLTIDNKATQAQLKALRGDVDAIQKFIEDNLPANVTADDVRDLIDGVAFEMRDVSDFIRSQKDGQLRAKRSQEIHAAIDIVNVLLQAVSPKEAKTFTVIAHQTVAAAEAVATMTTLAVSFTGVGTVVTAIATVIQALSDQPSAEEQLQSFILEIYRNIMAELRAIERGLFEVRTQLTAIESALHDLQLDSSIGFNRVLLAIDGVSSTLKGLALESERFYQASTIAGAQTAHTKIVDLMTNPANQPFRNQLSDPSSAIAAATQQDLSTIVDLGLHASKTDPFSHATTPLTGASVYATPRVDAVENRVGDLPALATLLMPLGATVKPDAFVSLAHSVALAQSVMFYVDARDRLPRPAQTDSNFSLLCDEVRHTAAAAREARVATPYAMRFTADAARRVQQIGRSALSGVQYPEITSVDREYLVGTAVPPVPPDQESRIQEALRGFTNGGFATHFLVIVEPVPVTQRLPTTGDLSHLDLSGLFAQPGPGDKVAVLDGCAVMEDVVFFGIPKGFYDSVGVRDIQGDRLYVRDRRKYCSDVHPLVAFPVETFGSHLEDAMSNDFTTLDEDPLAPDEITANDKGIVRIGQLLLQNRGRKLVDRARDDGILSGPFTRRIDYVTHTAVAQGTVPIPHAFGCVEWRTEALWSPAAMKAASDLTKFAAWTYGVEQVCTPVGGVVEGNFEAFLHDQRLNGKAVVIEPPSGAIEQDIENLDQVMTMVEQGRAKELVKTWSKRMTTAGDPLPQAVDHLRLGRYVFETFARYGYGDCSDPADHVYTALLKVTCAADPDCARRPADERLSSDDYLDLEQAIDDLNAVAHLDDDANSLNNELAADPGLCKNGGPFGLEPASAILNGLARRSTVFLPNGCVN
jgi:hypothetical protein